MLNFVKLTIFSIWPAVFEYLPKNHYFEKLDYRITMAKLLKHNPLEWRVRNAREMGAHIGENCRILSLNIFSEPYLVEIGDNVLISGQVTWLTHDGGIFLFSEKEKDLHGHFGRIKIGRNCFIGFGVIFLPNTEIGENSIVGAGSVVSGRFPKNSVIAGNPAKVIYGIDTYKKKKIESERTIRNAEYPFPREFKASKDLHKSIVMTHFDNIEQSNDSSAKKE